MKTIIHTVSIHAPPSQVYKALTTEEGVTGWWSTKATVDPEVGGLIRFTFLAACGTT